MLDVLETTFAIDDAAMAGRESRSEPDIFENY
jgi:hypothetical protein